jgi:catalase
MPPVARPIAPASADIADDCTQSGILFRLFTKDQQQRLIQNIAEAMEGVPEEIIERQLLCLHRADPQYAEGVARVLKIRNRVRSAASPFVAPLPGPQLSKTARAPKPSLI